MRQGYADHWAEFIGRRLLPRVPYRHEVFTVPDFLRGYFYRSPALLSRLMQIGHDCLRDILQRELLYHPRYGILREYKLFEEIPNDPPATERTPPDGGPLDRTERMVQIPLPFL